jgi:hypothetical protein
VPEFGKARYPLLKAAQARNINAKKLRGGGDRLKPVFLRRTLDDFGALRKARPIGKQDCRNRKCNETEAAPDVLYCSPDIHFRAPMAASTANEHDSTSVKLQPNVEFLATRGLRAGVHRVLEGA